jgi:hypothetical protein
MPFVEETGALVSVLVWLAFGAVALVPAMKTLTWAMVLYAILSRTVIRMVPVVAALVGAWLGWATVVVAWYAKLLAHRAVGGPGAHTPDMPDRRLIRQSSPPKG